MATALVFGDDVGPCLSVARSLGRRGIDVHLTSTVGNEASRHSRYVSRTHSIPRYTGTGRVWLERIRGLVAEHSYTLIIPTSDSSLAQLLRHRADLGEDRVAVPNPEGAEVFVDKVATRKLAKECGVPILSGSLIGVEADSSAFLNDLCAPAVFKRRRSYECGQIDQKSPVRLVHRVADMKRETATGRFELIEEFLPGYCRGVSVLAREGRILLAHQHRRLRQEHATGPSSCRVSEPCDPKLLAWTSAMTAATRLTGVAMFEYRCDPQSGRTALLEVNPRFWGSLPLAVSAGADFPALLFDMLVERRDPTPQIGSRPGVEKRNLGGECHALSVALKEAVSFSDYLRFAFHALGLALLLVSGRRFDSWAADDPRPFHAERRALLAAFIRFCGKRLRKTGRRNSSAAR